MIEIHPQKIEGRWIAGVALDVQTTSSTPVGYNEAGHMQFDTLRPPIAELLYQLKYKGNLAVVPDLVAATAGFLLPHLSKFDVILPVPASAERAVQPVTTLANALGHAIGKPVLSCITKTRSTPQLKGVIDPEERRQAVEGLYAVNAQLTAGKNILVFDDLYRSGTTLNAITDLLLGSGQAGSVRVLVITRTRSNR